MGLYSVHTSQLFPAPISNPGPADSSACLQELCSKYEGLGKASADLQAELGSTQVTQPSLAGVALKNRLITFPPLFLSLRPGCGTPRVRSRLLRLTALTAAARSSSSSRSTTCWCALQPHIELDLLCLPCCCALHTAAKLQLLHWLSSGITTLPRLLCNCNDLLQLWHTHTHAGDRARLLEGAGLHDASPAAGGGGRPLARGGQVRVPVQCVSWDLPRFALLPASTHLVSGPLSPSLTLTVPAVGCFLCRTGCRGCRARPLV